MAVVHTQLRAIRVKVMCGNTFVDCLLKHGMDMEAIRQARVEICVNLNI